MVLLFLIEYFKKKKHVLNVSKAFKGLLAATKKRQMGSNFTKNILSGPHFIDVQSYDRLFLGIQKTQA